jgi:hypothetical protein
MSVTFPPAPLPCGRSATRDRAPPTFLDVILAYEDREEATAAIWTNHLM